MEEASMLSQAQETADEAASRDVTTRIETLALQLHELRHIVYKVESDMDSIRRGLALI